MNVMSEKELAEVEHLRLEIARLRTPFWKNPVLLIPVLGLLISLAGNVSQYIASTRASAQEEREYQLAEARWQVERQKLVEEIEQARTKREEQAEAAVDRTTILAELETLKRDLRLYEEDKLRRTEELRLAELKLSQAISSKNAAAEDAQRKIVDHMRSRIEEVDADIGRLKARRPELETLLARKSD